MTAPLTQIIQPFQNESVAPTPYDVPGQKGTPPVVVHVGLKGGTKTFSWSTSSTASFYSPKKHVETSPRSSSLQQDMATLHTDLTAANTGGDTEAVNSFKQQMTQDQANIQAQGNAAGNGQS